MMSYTHSEPPCSFTTRATTAQKLYQAFIISIPVSSAFVILLFFYLCYLRRQRADWSSLRMRASYATNDISRSELGLQKEIREMLPIIVYKQSFSIRDTQCSVCLADYQAEDRLQHIPTCGHAFHMDCIDNWLTTHTTCPLCRLSLLSVAKASTELPRLHVETSQENSVAVNRDDPSIQQRPQASEETQAVHLSESRHEEERILQKHPVGDASSDCVDYDREHRGLMKDVGRHESNDGFSDRPISRTEPVVL